jgi:hypothetical protein
MPGKMKSACTGCGGEILYEKDSTGEETVLAAHGEYANLCRTCSTKDAGSETNSTAESDSDQDFENERNLALRIGGTSDQTGFAKEKT